MAPFPCFEITIAITIMSKYLGKVDTEDHKMVIRHCCFSKDKSEILFIYRILVNKRGNQKNAGPSTLSKRNF